MARTIALILFWIWCANCVNGDKTKFPFFAYLDLSGKTNSFAVSQITPGSGVSGIPLNTSVQVTFNAPFDGLTVTSSTFFVKQGNVLIPATITISASTAVLTPNSPFAAATTYTVSVVKGIQSAAGISLKEDLIWNFTTAATVDVIAPAVSLTTPNNGNPAVPNNSSVSVAFSEDVNCTTINNTTFVLDDGAAVAGSVSCSGTSATFTPATTFSPNRSYTAKITTGAQDLAGNSFLADFSWNFTTGAAPDTTAPIVSFINPPNASGNFSTNGSLSVAFSEAIHCATVNTANIVVTDGITPVVGTVACSGSTATFTPVIPLAFATTYSATIATGVKDLAGISLGTPFTWSFSTGAAPDSTAPTISFTTPAHSLTGVGINTSVSAVFSEPMNCATITTASFTLNGGAAVPGSVTCSGTSATFNPTAALAYNTNYTAAITTTAKDLAGNAVAAVYTWSFTTGIAPDSTAPTVSFVSPRNGATGVATNTSLSIAFSETMDCTTITTVSVTLNDGGPVAGTVGCSGTTATFTPTSTLAYGTNHTVTISTAVKDLAGIPLATAFTWSFSTSAAPDSTPPTVSLVTPTHLQSNVGINSSISAVFSEPMNCATITTASFTLSGGAAVPGTVACSGTSATFNPTAVLAYNTNYTAKITTAAKDLGGNPIAAVYTWTFTTGLAPDSTAPTVSFVSPMTGESNVPNNHSISIAFSEAIDCSTVTTASITVTGGAAIPGTVSCSGATATFVPTAVFAYGTNYTASISTAVKDLAGIPLTMSFSWNFTTGAAPDNVAPTIVLTSPSNGMTGVATNPVITVAFSETMDCSTLTTATISLNNGAAVPGTVNCAGTTATFTPTSNLPSGPWHIVAVNTGAKDLAGNPIGSNYTWSFQTGAAPDSTNPTVTVRNVKDRTVLESGFIIGTASDDRAVASVEVSVDAAPYALANGTANWSYQLPTGASTWKTNSVHTISVRSKDAAGNYSNPITVSNIRKGTNKDVNGDGYGDMTTSGYGSGLVYIFHSSGAAGITTTLSSSASRYIFGGSSDEFGRSVSLGDINADGYADLVVGAPLYSVGAANRGAAYVFHSSGAAGITISFSLFASTKIIGAAAGDKFGSSIATGDINGDGFTDLIVGAPTYSVGFANRGATYVFHSNGSGGITATDTTTASSTALGSGANEYSGNAVTTGSINGDFYDDIVVGAYYYNAAKGRVLVYHGSATGINSASPSTSIANTAGATTNDWFGFSVATGDVNGDGFSDVIAGALLQSGSAKGQVSVFTSSGTAAGIPNSTDISTINTVTNPALSIVIRGAANLDLFGTSLVVKDLDTDGRADIMSSVPNGGIGAVHVFMTPTSGSVSASLTTASATRTLIGPSSNFGFSAATTITCPLSAGDVNGDGYIDLFIGGGGGAYIFHSSSTGISTSNPASASTIINSAPGGGIGNAVF
ncbi:Ig-like domain-containing protein [Leptospira yasudae]|nr:Ig-like domain-containing protein [Leptospira yasudae]